MKIPVSASHLFTVTGFKIGGVNEKLFELFGYLLDALSFISAFVLTLVVAPLFHILLLVVDSVIALPFFVWCLVRKLKN